MNLRTLQDAIVARIMELDEFSQPPAGKVFPEYLDDLENRITTSMAKIGLVAVVREPEWQSDVRAGRGLGRAKVMIDVSESKLANLAPGGVLRPGIVVAANIASALTWSDDQRSGHWYPTAGSGWTELIISGVTAVNVGDPLVYRITCDSGNCL